MGLSRHAREALYDAEVAKAKASGRGDYPICKLCDSPILPGRKWDANHEAHKPRWLGGKVDGVSHRRCNRKHNNQFDTPGFAKSERVRKGWLDLKRSRSPMPGGRDDPRKRTMDGRVIDRHTGEPWRAGR